MDEFPEYTEEIGSCKECGNSPTNHFLTKVMATVDVCTAAIAIYATKNSLFRGIYNLAQHSGNGMIRLVDRILHGVGLITYAHDPKNAKSYRSRVIWEEAERRGIVMEQMVVAGMLTDTYRAKIGGGWVYFESLPIPPNYEKPSILWAGDKVLLKRELKKHEIPVPRFASVRTLAQAEKFLEDSNGAIVVKPRVGTRGRHTWVGIRTKDELRRAFTSAKVLCAYVSVEEALEGSVCRGTVINGKLRGFFQADPPTVIGDGKSTLQQLIEAADVKREERVAKIAITEEGLLYLARLGFTLESVPEAGEKISIGHRTGRLFGGKTRELLDSVHPRLKEYLERAATELDTPIIGFDLMIKDPEADPDEQKWGILEANTLPFIDLHYLPLYGKPSNPAAAIWDLWEIKNTRTP